MNWSSLVSPISTQIAYFRRLCPVFNLLPSPCLHSFFFSFLVGPRLHPPISQKMIVSKFTIKPPFGIVFFSSGIFRWDFWFTPLSFRSVLFQISTDISGKVVSTALFRKIISGKVQQLRSPLHCNLCRSVFHLRKITLFFSRCLPQMFHGFPGAL